MMSHWNAQTQNNGNSGGFSVFQPPVAINCGPNGTPTANGTSCECKFGYKTVIDTGSAVFGANVSFCNAVDYNEVYADQTAEGGGKTNTALVRITDCSSLIEFLIPNDS